MKHTKSLLGLAVAAALLPMTSQASGLFLPEGSSSGYGTAGAGDGVNTDSAAVMWTNPAAMAGLEGETLTINGTIFDLGMKYEDHTGLKNSPNAGGVLPTGGVFWAKPLNEKMTMGLAVSSLGGSAFDYSGWEHQGTMLATEGQLMNLQFNPSLSYRLNDQWSVGGGIQMSYTILSSESTWPGADRASLLKMEQTGDTAIGFNLGVFYEPSDVAKVGLSFRSKQEHEFSDDATVNIIADPSLDILPGTYTSSYKYAFTPFVAQMNLSGSYELNDQWKLLGSLGWQNWSDMDEAAIELADLGLTVPVVRNWEDTYQISVGAHYKLNNDWVLKSGITHETSPLDAAERQTLDMPMGPQTRFAVGATTDISENWTMDMYYEYTHMGNPDITTSVVDGEITDYNIHFIGAAFTRKFN